MYTSMIISFVQFFVQGMILTVFYSGFIPYRETVNNWYKKIIIIAGIALFITFFIRGGEWFTIQIETDFIMGVNIITALTSHFLVCHLLFYGKISRKLFLSLLTFIAFVICETLAINLLNPFWSEEGLIQVHKKIGWLYYLNYAISISLSLIVTLLVKRYRKNDQLVGSNRLFVFQCLLPICSIVFLYVYSALEWEHFDIRIFSLIVGFLALVNAYGYWFFTQQQKYYIEKYENLLITQDYQHREAYYQELEEQQKTVRMIRHDLKNQLMAASGTNKTVEMTELFEMLDHAPDKLTENIGLNQLIISKMHIAQKNDIECDFNIRVPKTMGFRQMDIGALIGNIMDNAIEACQRCSMKRTFQLELIYQGHALMIRSVNSVSGDIDITKTAKPDVKSHGFGMQSIKKIIEKYNGSVSWLCHTNTFELEALIWAPKC